MSDQELLTEFTSILEQYLEGVKDSHCAFLSTLDGHLLLKVENKSCPVDSLSPLGGSLLGISETVAAQFGDESLDHTVVFMQNSLLGLLKAHDKDDSLFLGIVASKHASVGMLLSLGKAAIESIKAKLD